MGERERRYWVKRRKMAGRKHEREVQKKKEIVYIKISVSENQGRCKELKV